MSLRYVPKKPKHNNTGAKRKKKKKDWQICSAAALVSIWLSLSFACRVRVRVNVCWSSVLVWLLLFVCCCCCCCCCCCSEGLQQGYLPLAVFRCEDTTWKHVPQLYETALLSLHALAQSHTHTHAHIFQPHFNTGTFSPPFQIPEHCSTPTHHLIFELRLGAVCVCMICLSLSVLILPLSLCCFMMYCVDTHSCFIIIIITDSKSQQTLKTDNHAVSVVSRHLLCDAVRPLEPVRGSGRMLSVPDLCRLSQRYDRL